jgi:hypothetical protein
MNMATTARRETILDRPTTLDEHRAKAKRKAAEVRRRIADVQAEQAALRLGRVELEKFLAAAPALSWRETVEKARYLLTILSGTSAGRDPRRQKLIEIVLEDFRRLSDESPKETGASESEADRKDGPKHQTPAQESFR